MTRIIDRLDQISDAYDALFCDLWGVLHNGKAAFPDAVGALRAFRSGGGRVVLLTNAPRPWPGVVAQIDRLGAPRDCWDLVVTSGDASQAAVAAGRYGRRVFHVGPDRDHAFFDDFDGAALPVERVGPDRADAIICTGLWDDQTESPADYADLIRDGVARGLTMLCANPDREVDVGDKRIYCGGAIAAAYEAAGGRADYYGKPHGPIYDLSRRLLADRFGLDLTAARTLAIGDGVLTDVPGAAAQGIDCLFVAGGLGAGAIGLAGGRPDPHGLDRFLAETGVAPRFSIGYLR